MPSTLALSALLLAGATADPAPSPQHDTIAPRAPAPPRAESKPFELGVQFGGMSIVDNPIASSSLYTGARLGYRSSYRIGVGVVGQYSDFSPKTSTGSEFAFWAARGELGYDLLGGSRVTLTPFAQLGYARSDTLWCSANDTCSRSLAGGSVGAIGLRLSVLGNWHHSGFEAHYQFGHVKTLFLGVSLGVRL